MSKHFSVQEDDKRLIISQDEVVDGLEIIMDYDDVYQSDVMRKAKRLCKILNEHWS